MPEISTEQKYARAFGLPEDDIAHADYNIITNILTVTYGIDQPRYKQKKVVRKSTKEFADYFQAPIFIGKGVDYILTAYLKEKDGVHTVRESRGISKLYYTSTNPVFGKITMKQFIETEVEGRGNYSVADVQNWIRKYGLSMNDLAIWVSPKKWVANRYNLFAEEWDKAEKIPESEMRVYEIKGNEGFIIPESDDGDEGYLFVFKKSPVREASKIMIREGGTPASDSVNIVSKIIQEVKEKPWTVPEKRAEIVARLKSASDEIDRKIFTEIQSFRPLGVMSEFAEVMMGAGMKGPKKGEPVKTPFGTIVFNEKRIPAKERVDRWDADHKGAERIRELVPEYAFSLQPKSGTVTGNYRVVEHGERLKAQGLLAPEEENALEALEKYWQEHPELDRQKGYGVWGHNLEIMVPESLRKNMIEKKGSLIDAILKALPGELVPIEYKDVPLGKRILLPSNITGSEIQRRGDLIVVAVQVDRDIVAYLYVQKGSQLIQIRPIPWQKMQVKPGELVNTPEYNMWVERIKKEAPEYLPEWEITSAGIRAGDTIIHKTAKYIAVVDKVYKNGNADITVLEAKGIPEWEKDIKEGFPIKIHVKDLDRYFEKTAIKGTETKQPWEMTRNEAIAEAAKPLGPMGISWGEMRTALSTNRKFAESMHKDMVKLAILEGKPVPPEVLNEYPDLVKKKENEKSGGTGMAEQSQDIQTIFNRYTEGYSRLSLVAVTQLSDIKLAEDITSAIPELSKEDALKIAPHIWALAGAKAKEMEAQEIKTRPPAPEVPKVDFWGMVKDLKITDVQVEFAPGEPSRGYKNIYLYTYALLENGKRVRMNEEMFKGHDVTEAQKMGEEQFRQRKLYMIGETVEKNMRESSFLFLNRYEEYVKQAQVAVQKRFEESGAVTGGTPARHILTVTQPEEYYFGTQVEVMQGADPELEPYYTGTVKRLLNNGELVEVHPEGDPREVSFRVPVDRVNVIRLVQQGEPKPPTIQPSPSVQARFNAYITSTVLTTGALASPKFLSDEKMAQDIERNIQVSKDEARALVPQFRVIAEKKINKEEVESVKELFGIDLEEEAHKLGIDLADYAIIKAGSRVFLHHKTIVQRQYEIKSPAGYMKRHEEELQEKYRKAAGRVSLTMREPKDYYSGTEVTVSVGEPPNFLNGILKRLLDRGETVEVQIYGETNTIKVPIDKVRVTKLKQQLKATSLQPGDVLEREVDKSRWVITEVKNGVVYARPESEPTRAGESLKGDVKEGIVTGYKLVGFYPFFLLQTIQPAVPPAAKPVQSIQEVKQQVLDSIQAARSVEELQPVLKGIGFLPLPEPEKRQVMDAYQNRYSILMSERPFGVPVKGEEKPKAIGAPTPQQLFESDLRRKAVESRRISAAPTLTSGGVVTSRRLEMFEPGAMEKAKVEVEVRTRIEQLGLPYEVHPYIRKLAAGTQDVMKFGAKRGRESVEDIVLARYVRYCPPGTIIDNRSMPRVPERWWVYPPKLRACMSDIEKKLAEAGAGMVKERYGYSQRFRYSIYHDGGLFANEDDPTEANSIYDMLVRTYPKSVVELRENFVHPRIHQRTIKKYPAPNEISVVREGTKYLYDILAVEINKIDSIDTLNEIIQKIKKSELLVEWEKADLIDRITYRKIQLQRKHSQSGAVTQVGVGMIKENIQHAMTASMRSYI